jgi:IS30 family transposase
MVNISQRPAEVEDRAVPGHWEGDLIIGQNQRSQIGTLVERSTGFVQLLHLPAGRHPDVVADAMIETIKTLPEALRRSLTWDQGKEMSAHARISIDAGIDIYFCDPHSPWQL